MSSLSPQPLTRRSHVVELYSEAPLPTARGTFRVVVFRDKRNHAEHDREQAKQAAATTRKGEAAHHQAGDGHAIGGATR